MFIWFPHLDDLLAKTGSFMNDKYQQIGDRVFGTVEMKQSIRKTAMELIPLLASFSPAKFKMKYLPISIKFLLRELGRKEKPTAMLTLAKMALVRPLMLPAVHTF